MAMLKNKQGIVFITALVMMFILLTLGMAYMMITRSETRITNNQINALKAFYAAEAGVEHSIAELRDGTDLPPTGLGDVSGSLGSYTYEAEFDDASTINSTGTAGGATRTIEVEISMSGFTGALQIISSISALGNSSGTVTGNVDAGGSINPDELNVYDVINGTITENKENIAIPSPTFSGYEDIAVHSEFDPNDSDGITYIDGNLTINGNDITVNGTIVVTGNLTMSNAQNFTITPSAEGYPAIVVGNNMNATNIEGSTFNGLVYVGHNASFNNWDNNTVTGAIVAGHSLTLNNGDNVSLTFPDSGLDPPHFHYDGTGERVTVTSWKGHPSP